MSRSSDGARIVAPSSDTILLTGAAGFVGRTLAPLLRAAFPDAHLVEVVRRSGRVEGQTRCDLSDRDSVHRLFAKTRPDVVIHLAAYSSVGLARQEPAAVWRDNAVASTWVAEAIAAHTPHAAVFVASTGEVYGRALNKGPAHEDTAPEPSGVYATSKLAAEHAFSTILPATTRLLIARPFNHTGPGQSEAFAIPAFAAQIARIEEGLGRPILQVGNLEARRDFLHVQDVAEAYVKLIARIDSAPPGTIVNLARGEVTSMRRALDLLLAAARTKVSVEVDPARLRPNEVPSATATIDRLCSMVAWPPTRSLEDIVAAVLADKRADVAAKLATQATAAH